MPSATAIGFALVASIVATAGPAAAQSAGPDPVSRAFGLILRGRPADAVPVLDSVVRRDTAHGRAWMLLGNAHRAAGSPALAVQAHRRALALNHSVPAVMYQLGLDHAQLGMADSAFHWFEAARKTGQADLTGLDSDSAAASLRSDPRYAALLPSPAEFARPFAEPVTILHEWRGEAAGDQFGWIARSIGDVDGDGRQDVVTSAPTHANGAGKVYVMSSGSGRIIWSRVGNPGEQLGIGIEGAGDVNADGVPDAVAGAPGSGMAYLLDGRDGAVLHAITGPDSGSVFGRSVTGAGDLDGDGHADVLVGAPQSSAGGAGSGAVYAISGRDGRVLHRFIGSPGNQLGVTGSGTAAGRPLLVLGAAGAGEGGRGEVRVHRGLVDEPAFVIENDSAGSSLGAMFVSVVGDIDADGVADVYGSDWSHGANGSFTGRVFLHSGADGRRLLTLSGEAPGDGFGIGTAEAGDVNGDGHDDLIIGAWRHASHAAMGGKVYLYSGRDGSLLRAITGQVMGETLGFDATGIGDVNGDGTPDLLVTSAWSAVSGSRSGRLYVISGVAPSP